MSEIQGLSQEEVRYRLALEEIARGDGVFGAQAHEYKKTARKALDGSEWPLGNPGAVYTNMLRGTIATPNLYSMILVHGARNVAEMLLRYWPEALLHARQPEQSAAGAMKENG